MKKFLIVSGVITGGLILGAAAAYYAFMNADWLEHPSVDSDYFFE